MYGIYLKIQYPEGFFFVQPPSEPAFRALRIVRGTLRSLLPRFIPFRRHPAPACAVPGVGCRAECGADACRGTRRRRGAGMPGVPDAGREFGTECGAAGVGCWHEMPGAGAVSDAGRDVGCWVSGRNAGRRVSGWKTRHCPSARKAPYSVMAEYGTLRWMNHEPKPVLLRMQHLSQPP